MSPMTGRDWKCLKCGKKNPLTFQRCLKCGSAYLGEEFGNVGEIKCNKCGKNWTQGVNYCPECQVPLYVDIQNDQISFAKLEEPQEIICHVMQITETAVLTNPDVNSERLYIVGIGDVFPIFPSKKSSSDKGSNLFSKIILPGAQIGYISKSSGFQCTFGLGKVEHPLGYIRSFLWTKSIYTGEAPVVEVPQPDGGAITVYKIKKEDALPVVEEAKHHYKIQLSSGMRGWVHKARVMRTLRDDSLPVEQKDDFLGAFLSSVVLLGLAAAMESYEVDKLSNAVAKGMGKKP